MFSSPTALYYHVDQLNTPQRLTDATGQVVWDAVMQPFGEVETPVAEVEQPLRFPGQYLDAETGLQYNYFRDYDPVLGRYRESDPIGLRGGLNSFGYVWGNPAGGIDPFGLCPQCLVIPMVCAGGACEAAAVALGIGAAISTPQGQQAARDAAAALSRAASQCRVDDKERDREKNCRALYESTLRTCASITEMRKKFRCFEAARLNCEQCMAN